MAEPTHATSDPRRSERLRLGVVLERRAGAGPWAVESWRVAAVVPGVTTPMPWTELGGGEGSRRAYAGEVAVELFRTETQGYRDNLVSASPTLWVILRRGGDGPHGIAVRGASVDPGEVEAHADGGDDLIEAVPLPPAVFAWVQSFVDRHHVERAFWKRSRDRADPEALGRRPRGPAGGVGHG